jgi:anti-sigma-K factor RskA
MEKTQRRVFETIELATAAGPDPRLVRRPDGAEHSLAAETKVFESTDMPGIYDFVIDGKENHLAFNLAADESRTAPLAVEELEHRGARVGTQPTVEQLAERQRQARIFELENRQKMWRWLIVAVLGVLLVETALAGRLAHRTSQPQVSP